MSPSPRVLYYHVIARQLPLVYSRGITPQHLEAQIAWLKRLGYHFVPLSQAITNPQPKSICLTTDDGFACNHADLLPLMRKYKLQPTLFLLGKCIDNLALAWNHKLIALRKSVALPVLNQHLKQLIPGANMDSLFRAIRMSDIEPITDDLWALCMPYNQEEFLQREKPFLSASQLQELVDCGAELALHSYSHPDFTRLSRQEASSELKLNIAALEQLKLPYHRLFAYPYGLCMDQSDEAKLMEDLSLQATFGIRYTSRDNLAPHTRWQRQNMEASPVPNILEFFLKPLARTFLAPKR